MLSAIAFTEQKHKIITFTIHLQNDKQSDHINQMKTLAEITESILKFPISNKTWASDRVL
jgi:hypothetical protein